MCKEAHRAQFEENAESYAPGDVPKPKKALPEHLPFRVSYIDCQRVLAENCELKGFCAVTLKQSTAKGGIHC